MTDTPECKWCGAAFAPKPGKKFCSNTHKNLFNNAARAWGLQAAHAGLVPVAILKEFLPAGKPCTADQGTDSVVA